MIVPVAESYYIADDGIKSGKVRVIPEEYTAAQAENQYVLFLARDNHNSPAWQSTTIHKGEI